MSAPTAHRRVLIVAVLLSLVTLYWVTREGLSTVDPQPLGSGEVAESQPMREAPANEIAPAPRPAPITTVPPGQGSVRPLASHGTHRLTVQLTGVCQLASSCTFLLSRLDGSWSDKRTVPSSIADWEGLQAGDYRVELHNGYDTWESEPAVVTLRNQQHVTLELRARSSSHASGRLIDATSGQPLRGRSATITLERRQDPGKGPLMLLPDSQRTIELDGEGGFCLDGWQFFGGMENTQVRFTATSDGYLPDSTSWADLPWTRFQLDDLIFALEPQAAVTGVVRSRQTGLPLAGALVQLRSSAAPTDSLMWIDGQLTQSGGQQDELASDQLSDAGGRFSFALEPGHAYRLEALASGHAPGRSASFDVSDSGVTVIDLSLPTQATLSGIVRVEGEHDFQPAQIKLDLHDSRAVVRWWFATLDDSGAFRVGDLQAGTYDLAVQASLKAGSWVVLHEQQLSLTEGEQRSLEIVLEQQPGLAVHGQVLHPGEASLVALLLDGDTGQPLGQPAPVAEDGRFVLRTPQAGALVCAVTSMPDGHELFLGASPVLVTGGAGQPTVQIDLTRTTLVLEPEQPRAVRWRLQPDTGQPDIDKALLGALAGLRASPPGRLTVHGLPPGRYQVFTTPPAADGETQAAALTVTLGQGGGEVVGKLP